MIRSILSTLFIVMTCFGAGAAHATTNAPQLPRCERPLASVMVGKLQCKAAQCGANTAAGGAAAAGNPMAALMQMAQAAQGGGLPADVSGIADGIHEVLVTALTESGCFAVQDREQMEAIQRELALAGRQVRATPADYLITGAVTQIIVSQDNKSVGGGLLGVLSGNPVIGVVASSVGLKSQKAAVALDMRLVEVGTAQVLASRRAEASSETSSFVVGAAAGGGSLPGLGGFGGSLSRLKGTNLEAVTKDAIVQSVGFLVEAVRTARAVQGAVAPTAQVLAAPAPVGASGPAASALSAAR